MDNNNFPIQPYFSQSVPDYEEVLSDIPGIHSFFQFRTTPEKSSVPIIPDNCIDLMFCKTGESMKVYYCGTVLKLEMYELLPDTDYFCVRFKMDIIDKIGDVPAKDCISVDVIKDNDDSLEVQIGHQLFQVTDINERINIFIREFGNCFKIGTDSELVNDIIEEIINTNGMVTIKELSDKFHYSYSYMYSQFTKHVGISPKLYCRITRFQYIMRSMLSSEDAPHNGESFGFYDQSHFYNEIKKFSGITPLELVTLQRNHKEEKNSDK